MASVNLLPVAAIVALCGVCLMYLGQWRAQRRLRSVMELELSRIFEQIDLLRLDQLPSNGEAYAAALELAARGAGHRELSARCGLGRDEARILVAMQNADSRCASAG